MKTKKVLLGVSISLVALIILCVILAFTLFSLKHIEISIDTTTQNLSVDQNESIINSASFKFGKPVFSMDKQAHIAKIEQANPYVEVYNIETVFPNKVIVHIGEREDIYKYKVGENTYVTDKTLKVLRISTDEESSLIDISSLETNSLSQIIAGNALPLKEDGEKEVLKDFINAMFLNNRNSVLTKQMISVVQFEKHIEPVSAQSFLMLRLVHFDGYISSIYVCEQNLTAKVQAMLACDAASFNGYRTSHETLILQNSSGDIVKQLIKK